MTRTHRLTEYAAAIGFGVLAFLISPPGIGLVTGRTDFTWRGTALGLTIEPFLLALIAALLSRNRMRRFFFHVMAWTFPFAVLGGIEAAAILGRLAHRIAPLADTSILVRADRFPVRLMNASRYYTSTDRLRLYRPWRGDGIVINELGLRTAPPAPKQPGEWRIAITGGSTVWGFRVLDADTIPAQLQDILRQTYRINATVYNFGIEGAKLMSELALLKHFRDTYGIDQVVFYTGGNDAGSSYARTTRPHSGPWRGDVSKFELFKTAMRLLAMTSDPPAQTLRWLDEEAIPRALTPNSLSRAVVAADDYCRGVMLRCDFALQPMLYRRKAVSGSEVRLAETIKRVYPRIDVLTSRMYREALASGPEGRVHDLSSAFDDVEVPYFTDLIHLNEAGNRTVAERLAPIVAAGMK